MGALRNGVKLNSGFRVSYRESSGIKCNPPAQIREMREIGARRVQGICAKFLEFARNFRNVPGAPVNFFRSRYISPLLRLLPLSTLKREVSGRTGHPPRTDRLERRETSCRTLRLERRGKKKGDATEKKKMKREDRNNGKRAESERRESRVETGKD